MNYRGTINIDFTGPDANAYTRLCLALRETGWIHVETSAFTRDTTDIDDLWEGIGLVARQAADIAPVSALTFHIQAAEVDFENNRNLTSTQGPQNAVRDIKAKRFPKD